MILIAGVLLVLLVGLPASWVLALLALLLPWSWAVDAALLGTPLTHMAFSTWRVAAEPGRRATVGEGPTDPETLPMEGPEEPPPPGSGPGPMC